MPVHSGEGHFGILVNDGKNVSPETLPTQLDGVKAKQEAGLGLFSKFSDAFLFLRLEPFSGNLSCSGRMIVESVPLNDFLDFPAGDFLLIKPLINYG